MPYETLIHYIWWNERSVNYDNNENRVYFKQKNFDDEFKEMIKRFYITQDYNPVLYTEHLYYNDLFMKSYPYCVDYFITERFYEIAPEKYIDYALIQSEIIVRIKTTDVVERNCLGSDGYIITSEIQDVIKGKVITTCKDITIPDSPEQYVMQNPYYQVNEKEKCIQFVFDYKYGEKYMSLEILVMSI